MLPPEQPPESALGNALLPDFTTSIYELCVGMCGMVHVCVGSQDNLEELVLFFYRLGPKDLTEA